MKNQAKDLFLWFFNYQKQGKYLFKKPNYGLVLDVVCSTPLQNIVSMKKKKIELTTFYSMQVSVIIGMGPKVFISSIWNPTFFKYIIKLRTPSTSPFNFLLNCCQITYAIAIFSIVFFYTYINIKVTILPTNVTNLTENQTVKLMDCVNLKTLGFILRV